jgi:hypothetical protein
MSDLFSYGSSNSDEESVNITLLEFIPTSTTNYYISKFNVQNRSREILFDGAVPLHEIVYSFYDLFFDYINIPSDGTIIHIVAILKPEPPHRPDIPIIVKLFGSKKKQERRELIKPVVESVINQFDAIFSTFINNTDGDIRTKTKYRTDTHKKVLIKAYNDFNNTIKPKIFTLLE